MLTGRSPNADAALCKPLKLTVLFRNAFILKIMPGQSVGRLFRDGTDRPGLECLALAEDDLGISLRNPLLIAGEIQVYPCSSPEKFRSISGSLSPLNPRNVSKGISNPIFFRGVPQTGQFLSGISAPQRPP